MGGVRGETSGSIQKTPAVRLCWNAEVTPTGMGIREAFHLSNRIFLWPGQESAAGYFLPALLKVLGEGELGRGVTCLPVKQAGLALPHPTLTALGNWTASCVITIHLVAAIRGQMEFQTEYHSACPQKGRKAVQKRSARRVEETLASTITGAPVQGVHLLQQATKTGAWLKVQPSTVN